ncbi:hypothetical protein [Rhizobium sp. SGZ-381]|uniref:hypothetical protein n=1 Tax=Rhizobium sp. SGZ-381 TaxID=3342800 RepID=UPI0036730951
MHAFRSRRRKLAETYDILPPQSRTPRPQAPARGQVDVVDVDFVTVRTPAQSGRPQGYGNDNSVHSAGPSFVGQRPQRGLIGEPASRVARLVERCEAMLSRMSADLFSAVVAFVFVVVFALCGGFSLLSGGAADAHPAPGLDITHVTLTPQAGGSTLTINGVVENRGPGSLPVPAIHAELLVDGAVVADALIDPPVAAMGGHHSHGFSFSMPHPGGKTPRLRLSFATAGASGS